MRRRLHEDSGTRILELLPSINDAGGYPLERILLTSRQVATALGIKRRTLAYWTATRRGKRPRLSYVKLGKSKRFIAADVLAFVDRLKVRSDADQNRKAA